MTRGWWPHVNSELGKLVVAVWAAPFSVPLFPHLYDGDSPHGECKHLGWCLAHTKCSIMALLFFFSHG